MGLRSEHRFAARLSAIEEGFLASASLQQITKVFDESLGVEFSEIEAEAIRSILSGNAVELLVKHKLNNQRPHCLLAAGCVLGLEGVSVHMLYVDDQNAQARFALLQTVAERLPFSVSLITVASTAKERTAAYASDIVCLSARERALDYLRDNLLAQEQHQNGELQSRFMKTLGQNASDTHSNATTAGFIEDIDLILSEGAMTPVHLYGESANASQESGAEEIIIAASSFFRVFSTYGRLGGIGEQLDDTTAESLGHYSVAQSHIDGLVKTPTGIVATQSNSVRSHLQIYPAAQPLGEYVAEIVESLLSQGNAVVVERVPSDELQPIKEALSQQGVNAGVGDLDALRHLALGTQQARCLLMPFSLSRLPDTVSDHAPAIDQSIAVVSFTFEESFRAEKRKRSRMQSLFSNVQFYILVSDRYAEPGIPAAVVTFLNLLPKLLRKTVVGALIRHKQKESDRHRARTIQSLIEYEKELDDLLAFSG